MCGLVGSLHTSGESQTGDMRRMADAIITRGPDDYGCWEDADAGISLGHRRLSILDLSVAGHQPMQSASGRYVLAFNGEIYNHLDIRQELESNSCAPNWRGHSDTETLLAGLDAWGIQSAIEHAIGMFAFAVWDRESCTLTLARDRVGEKPLYYGWQGQGEKANFLFGSELSALRKHSAFQAEINRDALCLYMRHNCVPAPYSIYHGISKLMPGCLLTLSLEQRDPVVCSYWSVEAVAQAGVEDPFEGTPTQAVDELEILLQDAVKKQMISDVPLGAFLSGGIDSSTVVALAQAQSSKPVKTFTIGFDEQHYNEAVHAKAVAAHLGTDHTELYVSPQQTMDVIQHIPKLYSEPFSDASQIPTYLVSQLARKDVTVSLSGDAGDELFCGYNRYTMASMHWNKLSKLPIFLRRLIATGLFTLSPMVWNKLLTPAIAILPRSLQMSDFGNKLHKSALVLDSNSLNDLYYGLVSHWTDAASLVIRGEEPATLITGYAPTLSGLDPVQKMMVLDMLTYLPDDILTKVDRAAMGVSLESRVPFLDHRVVEFAWRLPQSMKLRDGQGKWALRQVLYRHVPKELIERPKMGFSVPIDSWLRGPMRDWAESLLCESRLRQEGYINPEPIRKKWAQHLSGSYNWQHHLWDVLMFQTWLEKERV